MNKEESYAKIASLLVSIMPTKWEQVVFCLLFIKFIVNNNQGICKEFKF